MFAGFGHSAAEYSGVEVLVRSRETNLVVGNALEAVGDRRNARSELGRVADDDAIARKFFLVLGNERLEVLAANFFFAFNKNFDLQRQLAGSGEPRPARFSHA